MELTTPRLRLRDYEPRDFEAVHAFASRVDVVEHVAWGPNSREDTQRFLDQCAADCLVEPRTTYALAIVIRGTDEPVGSVGLHLEDLPGEAELGFVLHPDQWRQGYAREAAAELLRFGVEGLGLHRVWATCRPENVASARVLRGVGMAYEERLRDHLVIRGVPRDSLLFAVSGPRRHDPPR